MGPGQIRQPIALAGVPEPLEEALPGHLDEPGRLLRDPAAGVGGRAVAVVSVLEGAHVNGDNVPLFEHPIARNAVDDLVVDRHAHAGGKAVVVQEGGHGALRLDIPVYCSVNFTGCYAGGYHSSRQGASRRGNFPRPAHQLDLVA